MLDHDLPRFLDTIKKAQTDAQVTDDDLAQALGFSSASPIRAIKTGGLKFPMGRLDKLAEALNLPLAPLVESYLADNSPEVLKIARLAWGDTALTEGEKKVLEAYRALAKGRDATPVILDGKDILALVTL